MATERVVLTPDGKKKLEDELNELKVVKRAEVVRDIAEARAHGDLSENAEYDEAKNEEARVNARILELEELLATAEIVENDASNADTASIGMVVRVYDMEYDEEDEYTLVDFTNTDPRQLKISTDSPIGGALNGAHVGDTVEAQTPGGLVKLKVLDIHPVA